MPRFTKPPTPDYHEAAIAIEAAKVRKEFDEHLADILIQRAYGLRARERAFVLDIRSRLVPQIRLRIDTALVACICSTDPVFNHNLRIPKHSPYKREDTVAYHVRRLVELIYPTTHLEFVRQKTTGCMITIQSVAGTLVIGV